MDAHRTQAAVLAHEVELNEARLRHSTALAHLEEKLALAQADARRSRLRTATFGPAGEDGRRRAQRRRLRCAAVQRRRGEQPRRRRS
jgi:hypothetical protein